MLAGTFLSNTSWTLASSLCDPLCEILQKEWTCLVVVAMAILPMPGLGGARVAGLVFVCFLLVGAIYFLSTYKHHSLYGSKNSDTVKSLPRKVRLLCFIPTSPRNLATKASAVKDTWTPRCDKRLFFSSETDPRFPTIGLKVGEGLEALTAKTMSSFEYIYTHNFHEADWFFKADDDTYVIVENLRFLLSHFDPGEPLYFGHHFASHVKQGYMSGGGGYVLSREALRRLVEIGLRNGTLCRTKGGAEDVSIGRCMEVLGVLPGKSLDIAGRQTFHPFTLATHLFGPVPEWYREYSLYPIREGPGCCSELSITFHFVDHIQMHVMDHLLYKTQVYGIPNGQSPKDMFKQQNT